MKMAFTKLVIFSAIAVLQITFAFDNYQFKSQKISSYEIQETLIGHSAMHCCIYCGTNFLCEAVIFSEGKNCVLLTQIQSDEVSDTSAYVLQNRAAAKINKIAIKTSDEDYADTTHRVGIEICNEYSICCNLEPSCDLDSCQEYFNLDSTDTFIKEELSECQDFGLKSLTSVKVWMYDTNGWLGEYLKIYLDNQGHYNCLITKWLDDNPNYDQELSLECTYYV